MIKIIFICHGNICRSPMAEFVFRDMVTKKGLEQAFYIASAATSREEIGNGVHPGTTKKLKSFEISTYGKSAVQLTKADYENYDFLITMDEQNIRNTKQIIKEDKEKKIYKLLDFSTHPGNIADPWYTGNFDETYNDIYEGCKGLLNHILLKQNSILRE